MSIKMHLMAFFVFTNLNAANYFVSTSGSDSNPGSEINPFRTIQKALNISNSGDIINVASGTYSAFSVTGYGGDDYTRIQGSSSTISGNDVELYSSKYIIISGFEFDGSQMEIKSNSHHVTVENCLVHDARFGIDLKDSHHCIIRRNIVYGSELGSRAGEVGIRVTNSNYNLIQYNNVYNTFDDYSNGDGIGLFSAVAAII